MRHLPCDQTFDDEASASARFPKAWACRKRTEAVLQSEKAWTICFLASLATRVGVSHLLLTRPGCSSTVELPLGTEGLTGEVGRGRRGPKGLPEEMALVFITWLCLKEAALQQGPWSKARRTEPVRQETPV